MKARNRPQIVTAICSLATLAGCAPDSAIEISLSPKVHVPERSAVVFFADGLDRGRVDEMLAQGELPNIRRRFVEGGVCVQHAIASMPSDTYPNTVSILTGQFPGHHGILGNRWFDRYSLQTAYYITAATFRDVNDHFLAPTLFELLHGRFSVSVQSHTHRGAKVMFENDFKMGVDWLLKDYSNYDRRTGGYVNKVAAVANATGHWPSVTFYYFPGIDEVGHAHGAGSREYADAMRTVDAQIGRVTDAMEGAGLLKSAYFVLVSDHGHVQYDHHEYLNVAQVLRARFKMHVRERTLDEPDFVKRSAVMDRYDAVVMNGAFRRSTIYLRGEGGWGKAPTRQFVERIIGLDGENGQNPGKDGWTIFLDPAIEFAAYKAGADAVRIIGRNGSATIERSHDGSSKKYRISDEHGDLLGYRPRADLAAFVDAGWHASREWLHATATERIPDFVPQVVEMFDSPRAGDIVLFGTDHGTFFNDEESGHGSCLAADMKVTLFFAGPDLPAAATVYAARNADMTPTLLDLMNERRPAAHMDGVSIAEQLRDAKPSK